MAPAAPAPGRGAGRRSAPDRRAASKAPGQDGRRPRDDEQASGSPQRPRGPRQRDDEQAAGSPQRPRGPRQPGGSPSRRGGSQAGSSRPAGGPAGGRGAQRHSRADPVRRAACDVLLAVAERDAYANLLLPAMLAQRGLAGRDAALATELTYGTLRGQGTYDAVLAICSDRDLKSLDPPVREILRLGTHQLLATRVAPHAAVATSVDLVRDTVGQRPAGFVNAILRRVATRDLDAWLEIAAPRRADDIVGHLAVRHSHPRWIVTAFSDALGETVPGSTGPTAARAKAGPAQAAGADARPAVPDAGLAVPDAGLGMPDAVLAMPDAELAETEAVLAADNVRPRVTLCAVPGLAEVAEFAEWGASPARWSEFGAYLRDGDPARIPSVAQARAGAQDEASQLAAIALTRVPVTGRDSRWLDLCAGPGGKARLLAGLAARSGARLVAAELRPHRARLVQSAVSGWPARGTSAAPGRPAGVIVADGTQPAWAAGRFDRVIADVPCSGLGALRRRPEARWRRSPETVSGLHELQRRLLDAALESVRPGGVVAFVTCTPHLAETRAVLADVLPARPDIEVLDAPAILAEVPGLACPDEKRYAQFWPHRHGTDAIFLALLRRTPAA